MQKNLFRPLKLSLVIASFIFLLTLIQAITNIASLSIFRMFLDPRPVLSPEISIFEKLAILFSDFPNILVWIIRTYIPIIILTHLFYFHTSVQIFKAFINYRNINRKLLVRIEKSIFWGLLTILLLLMVFYRDVDLLIFFSVPFALLPFIISHDFLVSQRNSGDTDYIKKTILSSLGLSLVVISFPSAIWLALIISGSGGGDGFVWAAAVVYGAMIIVALFVLYLFNLWLLKIHSRWLEKNKAMSIDLVQRPK